MTDKYYLAKSEKMVKRENVANEFYHSILDPQEIPYIVTDDACLYDFFVGIDEELTDKVREKYGVEMTKIHFKMPFWQFLDWLHDNRIK